MTTSATLTSTAHVPAGSIPQAAWLATPSPGAIGWAERGWIPDWLIRRGIRHLLAQRLADERVDDPEIEGERLRQLRALSDASALAVDTDAANAQHYEVPADFIGACLGTQRKYSSAYYTTGTETLDQAESAMLSLTCTRAQVADGQRILELGCGWGSLSLWMAKAYPQARITGVSNSASQREHILSQAKLRGLQNIEIITADLREFSTDKRFDRIVSVECFEHMRNHRELFRRISGWLDHGGKLFIHIFTHRTCGYLFNDQGDGDWMSRHFFTGGMMPADAQFLYLQDHLAIEDHWKVSGRHYAQTSEHWLQNLDRNREAACAALVTGGLDPAAARLQIGRWRIFFLACAELWGWRGGAEWLVSHYRFVKR